jgi:hypothetical protein
VGCENRRGKGRIEDPVSDYRIIRLNSAPDRMLVPAVRKRYLVRTHSDLATGSRGENRGGKHRTGERQK